MTYMTPAFTGYLLREQKKTNKWLREVLTKSPLVCSGWHSVFFTRLSLQIVKFVESRKDRPHLKVRHTSFKTWNLRLNADITHTQKYKKAHTVNNCFATPRYTFTLGAARTRHGSPMNRMDLRSTGCRMIF